MNRNFAHKVCLECHGLCAMSHDKLKPVQYL